MRQLNHIEIGFQTYLVEGGEPFGAVRGYVPDLDALVVYVENAGDFVVPLEEIHSVHDGLVQALTASSRRQVLAHQEGGHRAYSKEGVSHGNGRSQAGTGLHP
jgi:hypothetical protein